MSLWRDMTSLWRHLFLNISLRSSKATNLLNIVPEGVKILSLGIKGIYNIFSECIFLEYVKLCRYISYWNYPVTFHTGHFDVRHLGSAILNFFKFICFIFKWSQLIVQKFIKLVNVIHLKFMTTSEFIARNHLFYQLSPPSWISRFKFHVFLKLALNSFF